MNAVNLLPEGRRGPRGFGSPKRLIAGLVVCGAVAGVGYWGWSLHSTKASLDKELTAATAERDELQSQLGAYQALQARAGEGKARQAVVVGLTLGRVNWERIVRNVATVVPRQVWLAKLKGQTPAATATGAAATAPGQASTQAPVGLHLEGFAFTNRQVALLMVRVGTVPGLGEPRLARAQSQKIGTRRVVRFEIDAPLDVRARDRQALLEPDATALSIPTSTTP